MARGWSAKCGARTKNWISSLAARSNPAALIRLTPYPPDRLKRQLTVWANHSSARPGDSIGGGFFFEGFLGEAFQVGGYGAHGRVGQAAQGTS